MKLWMAGAVTGVGVVGAALTGGASGPNDYSGVVGRPPQAVYAAFAALGVEGEEPVQIAGLPLTVSQRITKVPGERVRLELMVTGDVLLTADVHLQSANRGRATQVDAEVDVNQAPLERVIEASRNRVPNGVLDHARIDNMFRSAMTDMMAQVEAGRPLRSVAAIFAGRDSRPSGASAPPPRAAAQWPQESDASPQWGASTATESGLASGADANASSGTPGGWGKR